MPILRPILVLLALLASVSSAVAGGVTSFRAVSSLPGCVGPATTAVAVQRKLDDCIANGRADCANIWLDLVVTTQDIGDPVHLARYASLYLVAHGTSSSVDDRSARVLQTLGDNLDDQACFVQAEQLYRKALALRERDPSARLAVAELWDRIGTNLNSQGRSKDGEVLVRAALARHQAMLPPGDERIAWSLNNLAFVLEDQGRYREGEDYYRAALKVHELALPTETVALAYGYANLGYNLGKQGRYREGEALFRKGLDIGARALGDNAPIVAKGRTALAENLERQNRDAEAEALLRRATAVMMRTRSADPDRIVTLAALAGNLQRRGLGAAKVRTLLRLAQAGAFERMGHFTGFTPAAQMQLRRYKPILTGQVRAAWDLSAGKR